MARQLTARAVERAFRRAVADWRPIVGLTDWQVFVFVDPNNDDVAGARARPDYKELQLFVNPAGIKNDAALYPTARHVEYVALHELVHALVWVLAETQERRLPDHQARWHNENVTTSVARALWVARYGIAPPEGR